MTKLNAVYHRLTCLFKVSLVGNLLLVVTIVVLFIVRQTLRNQATSPNVSTLPRTYAQTDNAGQICLPCDLQGHQSGDTLYKFILKTENNNTLCCLERDDDLQNIILELEEENRYIRNFNRANTIPEKLRWWTERNHAAHLYANDLSTDPSLCWKKHGSKTSLLRNLTLSDDGRQLTVPAMPGAGMYFVYALYTFDFSNAATNRPAPIGVHNIYKHRSSLINGERQRLWTAKFGGENTPKRQTSFLCGIVNMNMLDTIESEAISYVAGQECMIRHIDRAPYSNYFGMFKLLEFV